MPFEATSPNFSTYDACFGSINATALLATVIQLAYDCLLMALNVISDILTK